MRSAKEVGDEVCKLRVTHGWSIQELASRAGISSYYIEKLESGKYELPSARVLYHIAEAFGLTIADLLGLPERRKVKCQT